MQELKKLIVIPTYNEAENICELIEKIYQVVSDAHILIVDDNSPDGTGKLIEELIKRRNDKRLFVIHREGKLGLGTAYVEGFLWGLEKGYDVFAVWADVSQEEQVKDMFETVLKKYGICRVCFREMAHDGTIPGVKKSKTYLFLPLIPISAYLIKKALYFIV